METWGPAAGGLFIKIFEVIIFLIFLIKIGKKRINIFLKIIIIIIFFIILSIL